jgi:antitoxin ParD1/3/4
MATTSLSLSPHWEAFIQSEVASGRYASASEVVRDGLRALEVQREKLNLLRAHVVEGEAEVERGEFAEGFDMAALVARVAGERP